MVPTQTTTPTTGDALSEVTPLIEATAFYGPPVVFFAAPWLVLGVMLSGPAAALMALLAALLVVAAVVAAAALLLASPFLLLRRYRRDPHRVTA